MFSAQRCDPPPQLATTEAERKLKGNQRLSFSTLYLEEGGLVNISCPIVRSIHRISGNITNYLERRRFHIGRKTLLNV